MNPNIYPYTGGNLQTNAFFVKLPEGGALFDAPGGTAQWLAAEGLQVDLLVLTHSHFDHVDGAAEVVASQDCPVAAHPLCRRMKEENDFFRDFGCDVDFEPVTLDRELGETESEEILGADFGIFHIPGHHPASLCFYWKNQGVVIGGDVLFRGGVGRWDLPGGNLDQLLEGIQQKLFPLPDDTLVLPGHGPETTIGQEKISNSFLGGTS